MRYAGLLIVALLFGNCATIPRTAEYYQDRLHVYVENESFERATIYLLYNEDGVNRQRLMSCEGLSNCNYWITKARSQFIIREGSITLGWRMGGGITEGQWLHGSLSLSIYTNMTVIMKIGVLTTWLYPGEADKKA